MSQKPGAAAFLSTALAIVAASESGSAQQAVERVSVSSSGIEGNDRSDAYTTSISADGRYVAFASVATNLVANDTNATYDVFVHDRATGATVRVSVDSAGAQADGFSVFPALSADGRFVSFYSGADNLAANDTNQYSDVFVHDRDPDRNGIFDEGNGITTCMSLDPSGVVGNRFSEESSITGDGRYVVFESMASTLVSNDTNRACDVFVRDRDPDGNGIFDEGNGTTARVSVRTNGHQGDLGSFAPVISADGLFVAFESQATDLVSGDTNVAFDIFLHDMTFGTTRRVSVDSSGTEATFDSNRPSISAKGECVAFESIAPNLVANDTNQTTDIFVRDVQSSLTERVSVDSFGNEGNKASGFAMISGDRLHVAFGSYSTNLTANGTSGDFQTFVHDRGAGVTTLASMNGAGAAGDGDSFAASITADGNLVAFTSSGDNLVTSDNNQVSDAFVLDRTIPPIYASWTNYGSGFSGTFGVPSLVVNALPVFGTTISMQIDNSALAPTAGILFVGFGRASIPTNLGGTLLVDFTLTTPLALPFFPPPIPLYISPDPGLVGVVADLQVVEVDAGALKGWSFTPGLELVLGL